jgi:hypothetical protein
MESSEPKNTKQTHAPIKSLSDPVQPTDAKLVSPAAGATHPTMIHPPTSPRSQSDSPKK